MTEVKILKPGVILDDRVCGKGELVKVRESTAHQLVSDGSAGYTAQIRALTDIVVGTQTATRGVVLEVSEARAAQLVEDGVAEHYGPAMAHKRPVPARNARPVEADASGRYPRVRIMIRTEGTLIGNRVTSAGDVVDAPEPRAVGLVEGGHAELAAGAKLTDRGFVFLSALKRRIADATY